MIVEEPGHLPNRPIAISSDPSYNGIGVALWLTQLQPEDGIGKLPLQSFSVSGTTCGREVVKRFRQESKLPGVVITAGAEPLALLSRQKLLEYLCWQRGAIALLDRPIDILLQGMITAGAKACAVPHLLQLSHHCPIDEAVAQAISRPKGFVQEPLLVIDLEGKPKILNFYDLTMAQSHLTYQVNQTVQMRRRELGKCRTKILQQWQEMERSQQSLEAQTQLLSHREQFLERQRSELLQQMDQNRRLKHRLEQIEQTLSAEGIAILQTLLGATQSISNRNHRTAAMTKALMRELETIQCASRLIHQLSRQVQYLGVRSAVLANRYGTEVNGFKHLADDIRQLSQQTQETGKGMDDMTHVLRSYIADLASLTQEGTEALHASVHETERIHDLLRSLDDALKPEDEPAPKPPSTVTWINPRFRVYISDWGDQESQPV